MNIIHNAIQAMDKTDEKKLSVRTSFDKQNIYIAISDTGCGISKKNQSKLFSPFFTTKEPGHTADGVIRGGTGLGLYSSYQLLQPYGVTYEVKSQIKQGTTFIITVPLNPDPQSEQNN
jgi:signal transduction histidine kinase